MQIQSANPSTPNVYNSGWNQNSTGPQSFAGQVRYNANSQGLEIFDGSVWQIWSSSIANIQLTPEAERILDWARQKMDEEQQLQERLKRHPGLKDAYEKFKIMDALTMEEDRGAESEGTVQAGP